MFSQQKFTLTTINLIATVGTIRFTVAVKMSVDAGFILLALELIRSTSDILTDRRQFVIALRTILFSIANPTLMDTGYSVATLVLQRKTRVRRLRSRIRTTLRSSL